MKSLLRLLLLATGAILVVGLAAFIVASAALDPNRLRATLQDSVHRATGRVLTIAGPVHLRFGLQPSFEVDDIALANIEGGSRPQMVTARRLTAELALLPLLGGDAVISALTVQDADIVLERGPDGTPNWQFAPARRALYPAQSGTDAGGGHRVEVRAIRLDGGRLAWQGTQGRTVAFGITRLVWSADGRDLPMRLEFDGTQGDVPVSLKASSGSLQRLQGGPVSALAGAWPLTADLGMPGAGVHLDGGFSHPDQARGYQFRVTANAPRLEAVTPLLAPLLGLTSLPPLVEVNATAVLSDTGPGELRTSQVSIHAGESDLRAWVPGLAVRQVLLSAPGPGQLMQASLDGTYQDTRLNLAATAMQPDAVGAGGPVQTTISGQAAGATFSAHGTLPPTLSATGLDMAVSLHAPDLAALAPLVGRALPPARDVTLDARLGDAGVRLRGVAVRDLAVASSLGDVSGELTVQWAPRAALSGTLTSRVLDLDTMTAPLRGALPAVWPPADRGQAAAMAAGPPDAAAAPGAAVPALPLAWLRRTDADLAVAIGSLTAGGQHLEDVQAHLQLLDGKLALNPFRAQSPEGAVSGGVSLDASSDDPPVAVTLRSSAIAAAAMAELLGYPGGARGTMQVDAQLSGVGRNVAALEASLDGHLGLAMVNGEIEDALVQGLIGAALDTAGVPGLGGGTSQVRCLALRVDFSRGLGRVRALAADTSRLSIEGDGTVDLHDGAADLHLRPRVRLGPTDVTAPVWLHGRFGALRGTLDPVLGGGRVGLSIGGGGAGPSSCGARLALARGGLGGPPPAAAAAPADAGLVIRKPKDLLKGLFH